MARSDGSASLEPETDHPTPSELAENKMELELDNRVVADVSELHPFIVPTPVALPNKKCERPPQLCRFSSLPETGHARNAN